ncbi:MAG: hypothetical protein WC028_29415 [Candidatus Obscuribacterales bacterium]
MNLPFILIMVAVVAGAMLIGPPVLRWVRSVVSTAGIRNDKARKLADAALYSATYTTLFTVAFALLGMPYGLGNIIFVFLLMTVLDYFMPSRP